MLFPLWYSPAQRRPPMPENQQTVIRFGPFEADLQTVELRKHGVRLRLPAQSFQILRMLLERPGKLVTREEVQKALWPSDTFVDFDHGVNAAVNRLRDALGDSANHPRLIETLPRRGYRFIGGVTPEPAQVRSARNRLCSTHHRYLRQLNHQRSRRPSYRLEVPGPELLCGLLLVRSSRRVWSSRIFAHGRAWKTFLSRLYLLLRFPAWKRLPAFLQLGAGLPSPGFPTSASPMSVTPRTTATTCTSRRRAART